MIWFLNMFCYVFGTFYELFWILLGNCWRTFGELLGNFPGSPEELRGGFSDSVRSIYRTNVRAKIIKHPLGRFYVDTLKAFLGST